MLKYNIYLGTFENNKFTWKKIKEFDDRQRAFDYIDSFMREQTHYTVEEMMEIWNSPRLDIELKVQEVGKEKEEMLKWYGLFNKRENAEAEDSMHDCSFGPRL